MNNNVGAARRPSNARDEQDSPAAAGVSTVRLYVLRAMYLLLVVGLGVMMWPRLINHTSDLPLMEGLMLSMLAAVSVLAAVGIRYPLKMLPVLFFELVWKSIWLLVIALPLWLADQLDERTWESVIDTVVGVVLVLVTVPWGYAMREYVKRPSDRWK